MGQLIHKKMSLFDAPKGSLLVHACNTQGVWGSGIAAEFKKRFPDAFEEYFNYCQYRPMDIGPIEGDCMISEENNGYTVGCLMTSSGFANTLDDKDEILFNTRLALHDLFILNDILEFPSIYSNKFNSGLFRVPWDETEKILKEFVEGNSITWITCDPNLKEAEND